MMEKRSIICFMLALLIALGGVLAGCGGKKEVSQDEKVELKWVFGGPGKLEDSEYVWGEFNKKLESYLPNTTVKFTCIPHSNYAEKWRLMSASQEEVDIAWISWALKFADEVAKGSYMDITDLINEYGQDMKADFPEWLLDLTTINGRVYAIPNYQMMTNPTGFSIKKSHVDKGWIDLKEAEKVLTEDDNLTKDDYKIFEDYFKKVIDSGEKVKYVSDQFLTRAIYYKIGLPKGGLETITANAAIAKSEDGYKVYNTLTDFPGWYEYYDVVNDWYNKGIIRKDILENPKETEGDYLLWWCSLLKGEELALKNKYPNDEMTIFACDPLKYIPYNGSNTNTAIASQSKHPERAMQLLNLMNSKKGAELLNMLSFGIEGEHYNKTGDNRIEFLGSSVVGSSNNKYGYENWALGNALVTYETQNNIEGWGEYVHNEINMQAEISRLAGFNLEQNPIKLEIAQYNAIMKEYEYLDAGTTANYKDILTERNAKLREAGSDKIVEEVQRQVDEWVKANNK